MWKAGRNAQLCPIFTFFSRLRADKPKWPRPRYTSLKNPDTNGNSSYQLLPDGKNSLQSRQHSRKFTDQDDPGNAEPTKCSTWAACSCPNPRFSRKTYRFFPTARFNRICNCKARTPRYTFHRNALNGCRDHGDFSELAGTDYRTLLLFRSTNWVWGC